MRNSGFTLIEILITVGIIAVLAAIAVPNYQTARTRAKVARTYADLRHVGVAITRFYIDSGGNYPTINTVDFISRLTPLTTPLAYLAQVPEDPFAEGLPPSFDTKPDWMQAYKIQGTFVRPFPFEYMYRKPTDNWSQICTNYAGVSWALKSVGPDMVPVWFGSKLLVVYDPSNGTTSFGDIIITGPGLVENGRSR